MENTPSMKWECWIGDDQCDKTCFVFCSIDDLKIKINSNTKSSEVITLKVKDNYTEGESKTRLKNYGYICK